MSKTITKKRTCKITNKAEENPAPEIKLEILYITVAIAQRFMQHNTKNRHKSSNNVKLLIDAMSNDFFTFNVDPICFNCDGSLINGQHRLASVIKTEKPQWFLVLTGVPQDAWINLDECLVRRLKDYFDVERREHSRLLANAVKWYYRHVHGQLPRPSNRPSNYRLLEIEQRHPKIGQLVSNCAKYETAFKIMKVPFAMVLGLLSSSTDLNVVDNFLKEFSGVNPQKMSTKRFLTEILKNEARWSELDRNNRYYEQAHLVVDCFNAYKTKASKIKLTKPWEEEFPNIL